MFGGGGFVGGVGIGSLMARGGMAGFGIAGVYGAARSIGPLAERAGRLADLPSALQGIAVNTGVASGELRGLAQRLEQLDFSAVQAQKSVAFIAQTRIPELIASVTKLGDAARNFSVISGSPITEVFEGLVGGIVKEEVEILETQGLLIKFSEGYAKYAAEVGKTVHQLTEEEKAISRLNQVLEKSTAVTGLYAQAQAGAGGALRDLSVQAGRAFDALAQLASPAIAGGASRVAQAFQDVAFQLKSIKTLGDLISSGNFWGSLARGGGIGGAMLNQMVQRDPRVLGTLRAPGIDYAGAVQRDVTGRLFPTPPPPEPQGRYNFSQLTLDQLALNRARAGALASSDLTRTGLPMGGGPFVSAGLPAGGGMGGVLGFGQRGAALPLGASDIESNLEGLRKWNEARERMIRDEQSLIERVNRQIFDDLRFQSQGLFRAMLQGGGQFWNVFKNLGLTVISDVMSRQVATLGMGLLGRGGGGGVGGVGRGRGAGLSSLLMGGGAGMVGRPGAPGGTSGFAGPVTGMAGAAGLGAVSGGGLGLGAALGSSALLGFGGAIAAAQLPGRGPLAGGLRGGLTGAGAGVGSLGLLASLAPGLVATGPLGALILGGAIGVGALIGGLKQGAMRRARTKVRSVYGIEVKDNGVLQQIVEAGKSFGGNLDAAIHSPAIRDIVQMYAMSTGQTPGGGFRGMSTMNAVRLRQQGGLLYQDVQFVNGQAAAAQSSLPLLGVGPRQSVQVISLDAAATEQAIGAAAQRAVAGSFELVQSAGDRAMRQSAGRRRMTGLLFEPFTAVES